MTEGSEKGGSVQKLWGSTGQAGFSEHGESHGQEQ